MDNFDKWLNNQGVAPPRKGIFDEPVPGKPVPKGGGDSTAAPPAPPAPAPTIPTDKAAGNQSSGRDSGVEFIVVGFQ